MAVCVRVWCVGMDVHRCVFFMEGAAGRVPVLGEVEAELLDSHLPLGISGSGGGAAAVAPHLAPGHMALSLAVTGSAESSGAAATRLLCCGLEPLAPQSRPAGVLGALQCHPGVSGWVSGAGVRSRLTVPCACCFSCRLKIWSPWKGSWWRPHGQVGVGRLQMASLQGRSARAAVGWALGVQVSKLVLGFSGQRKPGGGTEPRRPWPAPGDPWGQQGHL